MALSCRELGLEAGFRVQGASASFDPLIDDELHFSEDLALLAHPTP